jgi:creatinine amidohydrolase
MTIDEVRAFKPQVAVLPLGSTEPHGPHLPYGTDTFQITNVCREGVREANSRGARALLYPTLPITNNANVRKFPFACRIGIRTLMTVIIDIVTQAKEDGVMKVVICNGHGGNPGAIAAAMREIAGMDNMPFVCLADPHSDERMKKIVEHASDHAGESETSQMLYLRPDLVRTEKFANNPIGEVKVPALKKAIFVRPWHLYVSVSAGGETRKSTEAKGKALQEVMASGLTELLVDLSKAKFDSRFPYK